jgi:oligopeptide transport system substrate-binding protein
MLDEIKLRDDYHVVPNLATYYYEFNINDPVLKDMRVRKALAMSINKQDLVDKVLKGGQIATDAFVPPMEGYTPTKGNSFNIGEAKKLLAAAGYPDGKGFPKLTVSYSTSDGNKKIAEYIQEQLKTNLGITIALQNMEWATFLSKCQANDFQIAGESWIGDYQDPSNFLQLCKSDGGNNDGRYNNPDFDSLLKKASHMKDGSDRMKVLEQAENELITKDQVVVPFYYRVSENCIDLNKWDGWYTNTQDLHPYVGIKLKK